MPRFRDAAILAALLVSGCGDSGWTVFRFAQSESTSSDIGLYLTDANVSAETRSATPPLASAPRRKPMHEAAKIPDRPFLADPHQLLGLDFESTKALLGDPALRVEKPPAKVWAYSAGICGFNVFFYPTIEDEQFNVLAYEVTDGSMPAASVKSAGELGDSATKDQVIDEKSSSRDARRCLAVLLASRDSPRAR